MQYTWVSRTFVSVTPLASLSLPVIPMKLVDLRCYFARFTLCKRGPIVSHNHHLLSALHISLLFKHYNSVFDGF